MENLSQNWITEKHLDFEYKKYLLLGYLQHVSQRFDETHLYPYLAELITHYKNALELRNNKKSFYESFTERVSGIDLREFKLLYDKLIADDELMRELESIIEFSIPQFEKHLNEGKKIYDFVETNIHFSPVGIIPIHVSEGYIFLKNGKQNETRIYTYQVTLIERPDDRYRSLHTSYVCSYEKSLINTFESIKGDLMRYNKNFPNPATYLFESEMEIPIEQTFLPIAKRMLMKYVAQIVA